MNQDYYEKVYYRWQVEARGICTDQRLRTHLIGTIISLDENVGGFIPQDRSIPCLDLGCGFGKWLYYLKSRGFINVRGVDLDPRQVELATSVGLPAEIMDAHSAVAQCSDLGLVIAWDLIEHMDKNDAVRLLENAHAALRPGGLIFLHVPCADGFFGAHDWCNDFTHRWSATSNMLSQLLRTVGFAKVHIIDPSMPPFARGIKRQLLLANRKILRRGFSLFARALGIVPPAVWANSQIVLGWKKGNTLE